MKFSEAMAALEAGKKVCKSTWLTRDYIYRNAVGDIVDEEGDLYEPVAVNDAEWHVMEEESNIPKKKILSLLDEVTRLLQCIK